MAIGGSESSFTVPDRSTSGHLTGGHIGVYAVRTWSAYYAASSVSYARFDNSTTRDIAGVGTSENAKGRFASDAISGRLEIGWRQSSRFGNVTPFVAVEPAVLWQHAFTEGSTAATGGSGILGLNVAAKTVTSVPAFLGVQFDRHLATHDGAIFAPYARAAWVHEFEPDRQVTPSFVTLSAAAFTVDGARPASDLARVDGGATYTLRTGEAMFANLTGEWSGRTQAYAATAGFRLTR
jgi:outer membrane autotransporter protein